MICYYNHLTKCVTMVLLLTLLCDQRLVKLELYNYPSKFRCWRILLWGYLFFKNLGINDMLLSFTYKVWQNGIICCHVVFSYIWYVCFCSILYIMNQSAAQNIGYLLFLIIIFFLSLVLLQSNLSLRMIRLSLPG